MQIYVQSRRLDIRPYLEILRERVVLQDNDLMRTQLREYMEFINSFTNQVDIMTKNFFVAIPYTPSGIESTGISKFLNRNNVKKEARTTERFFEDRTQLEQRVSIVEQGLSRIGIRTTSLGTDELRELFYHIFNPGDLASAPKQN